jgi:ribosome biogenesis GTPase
MNEPHHTGTGPPPGAHCLVALGWTPALADAFIESAPDGRIAGRVARIERTALVVLSAAGELHARIGAALLAVSRADPLAAPTTGDWVVLTPDGSGGWAATRVLPRTSVLVRASVSPGASVGQVLAANVDVALVVEPLWPGPNLGRIERLMTLAWDGGASPTVVLTKADLVADLPERIATVTSGIPGVEVLAVSTLTGAGLDRLRALATPSRTLVLLGPSGAGKSTLVNALSDDASLATAEVRVDGAGRHTTVHRELRPVRGGGVIIDTPGLRSVGLVDSDAGLDRAFEDIAELARHCRFRDCGHESEPGCAVRAAVAAGTLSRRRLENWRRLRREAAWMARRQDARLAAAEKARVRQIHRELRSGRHR